MLCILAFDKPKPNYIKFLQGLIVGQDFYKGIIKMRTIINTNGLVENGLINIDEKKQIEEVAEFFSIGISKTMQGQILNNNNNDPIFAQFVPSALENIVNEYEIYDPIGDDEHLKLNGLVHRYNNRALVKLNKVCPVYCRFCFRREKIGRAKIANGLNFDELNQILEYLEKNSQINEVILSGGDPLIYNKKSLSYLCEGLNKLPNIEILRIHSRVPIVSPELVNSALLNSINKFQKAKFLIIHINHIQELSEISIIQPHRDSPEAVRAFSKICLAGNFSHRAVQFICSQACVHWLGLQQGYAEVCGEDIPGQMAKDSTWTCHPER